MVDINANGTPLGPGTAEGDLVQWDATQARWVPLAVGVNGEYLGSDGTNPVWSSAPGIGWTHIETLDPSGATTISTTGTLPVYEEYMVIGSGIVHSQDSNLSVRFNGDSGSTYQTIYVAGTTVVNSTATGVLLSFAGTVSASYVGSFRFTCPGISRAAASGRLPLELKGMGGTGTMWAGWWIAGNAVQITSMTFVITSGTYSGKMEIFGRNRV